MRPTLKKLDQKPSDSGGMQRSEQMKCNEIFFRRKNLWMKDLLEKGGDENKMGITFFAVFYEGRKEEKIRRRNLCFSAVIRQRKGERVKKVKNTNLWLNGT